MRKYDSCLDCSKRFIGCHTTCEDYKKYREYLEFIKNQKKKYKWQFSKMKYK